MIFNNNDFHVLGVLTARKIMVSLSFCLDFFMCHFGIKFIIIYLFSSILIFVLTDERVPTLIHCNLILLCFFLINCEIYGWLNA